MNHPRHEMMQTALRKWAFETDPMPAQQPLDFEGDEHEPKEIVANISDVDRSGQSGRVSDETGGQLCENVV